MLPASARQATLVEVATAVGEMTATAMMAGTVVVVPMDKREEEANPS